MKMFSQPDRWADGVYIWIASAKRDFLYALYRIDYQDPEEWCSHVPNTANLNAEVKGNLGKVWSPFHAIK